MTSAITPREFAEQYLAALRGELDHGYLEMWDDDITYRVPGEWPMGGHFKGKQAYLDTVNAIFSEKYEGAPEPANPIPGAGLYGFEYIVEGQTVVIQARSRARDGRGMPYTNTFFMWFELNEEGKAIDYMDMADFSSGWQAFFGASLKS